MNGIKFIKETVSCQNDSAFVIHLSNRIKSKDELLHELSKKLRFPDYFGKNWDALYDCLTDLTWLEQKEIMIVHHKIPMLNENEIKIYLTILVDAINLWKKNEEHELEIFFPSSAEAVLKLYIEGMI